VPQILVFELPDGKQSRGLMSGEHEGQETEEPIQNPRYFRTAIDALRGCNVVEHRFIETTCEDAF
jgi:hypothetical protein